MESADQIQFAAENTLGKLAKWLRILGFDTLYLLESDSKDILRSCARNRLLLTRTQRVAGWLHAERVLLIEPDAPRQQVRQVIRQLAIQHKQIRLFSRCVRCNMIVVPIGKDEVFDRVPDYVWETHRLFSTCPGCHRIYWTGSHFQHSLKMVESFFDP